MGYTLVASFDAESKELLHSILDNEHANKIPFGRNCDRAAANEAMDYHMTILHWAKAQDSMYLPRSKNIPFSPFQLCVTESALMYAEEGSLLLYFAVVPGENYRCSTRQICGAMGMPEPSFLHITLAVSTDHEAIKAMKDRIDRSCTYPFTLTVSGLDLYHIWKPVYLAAHIQASDAYVSGE